MSRFLNDGSTDAPKLRVYLNLDSLIDLRADTMWPGVTGTVRDERLRADNFEGIQLTTEEAYLGSLPFTGLARINVPGEADAVIAKHSARGDQCDRYAQALLYQALARVALTMRSAERSKSSTE